MGDATNEGPLVVSREVRRGPHETVAHGAHERRSNWIQPEAARDRLAISVVWARIGDQAADVSWGSRIVGATPRIPGSKAFAAADRVLQRPPRMPLCGARH